MAGPVENLIRSTVGKGVMKIAAFNRQHMAALEEPHAFLNGIHAPMERECTLTDLQVRGTIPLALEIGRAHV